MTLVFQAIGIVLFLPGILALLFFLIDASTRGHAWSLGGVAGMMATAATLAGMYLLGWI